MGGVMPRKWPLLCALGVAGCRGEPVRGPSDTAAGALSHAGHGPEAGVLDFVEGPGAGGDERVLSLIIKGRRIELARFHPPFACVVTERTARRGEKDGRPGAAPSRRTFDAWCDPRSPSATVSIESSKRVVVDRGDDRPDCPILDDLEMGDT